MRLRRGEEALAALPTQADQEASVEDDESADEIEDEDTPDQDEESSVEDEEQQ